LRAEKIFALCSHNRKRKRESAARDASSASPKTRARVPHMPLARRESESLGTDSLVFCRCGPFGTLLTAIATKNFSRCKISFRARFQACADKHALHGNLAT